MNLPNQFLFANTSIGDKNIPSHVVVSFRLPLRGCTPWARSPLLLYSPCRLLLFPAFVTVSKRCSLVVPNDWLCLSFGVQTRHTTAAPILDVHPKLGALNKLGKRRKRMRRPTATLGNGDSSFNQGDFKNGLALQPPDAYTKLCSPGPFFLFLSFSFFSIFFPHFSPSRPPSHGGAATAPFPPLMAAAPRMREKPCVERGMAARRGEEEEEKKEEEEGDGDNAGLCPRDQLSRRVS